MPKETQFDLFGSNGLSDRGSVSRSLWDATETTEIPPAWNNSKLLRVADPRSAGALNSQLSTLNQPN